MHNIPAPLSLQCAFYFQEKPILNNHAIETAIQHVFPTAQVGMLNPTENNHSQPSGMMFAYPELRNESMLSTILLSPTQALLPGQSYLNSVTENMIQQSWSLKNAANLLQSSSHRLLLIDQLFDLPWKKRFAYYHLTLQTLLKNFPTCQLIEWVNSQELIEPQHYLNISQTEQGYLYGAINVRLYRVSGQGDHVIDTLGMHVFGLPDLQCHVKNNLDPDLIIQHLYLYANYLFEQGDILQDNETVDGIFPSQVWTCRREISLVEPQRLVINFNPGAEFYAGI